MGAGNAVVTIDTRHLLDQILLDGNIETERRRYHTPPLAPLFQLHSKTLENIGHLLTVDLDTEDAGNSAMAQGDARALWQGVGVAHLNNGTCYSAGDRLDQCRSALDGTTRHLGVDATLEAV